MKAKKLLEILSKESFGNIKCYLDTYNGDYLLGISSVGIYSLEGPLTLVIDARINPILTLEDVVDTMKEINNEIREIDGSLEEVNVIGIFKNKIYHIDFISRSDLIRDISIYFKEV